MKTTKSIIVILTIIVAMSLCFSCAKVERVKDQTLCELTLSPLPSAAVKSTPEPLADGTVFGIFSYYSDMSGDADWKTAFPSSTSYLDNVAFKIYSGTAQGWDPEKATVQPYYWPLAGSLMFAGYCPHLSTTSAITSVALEPNKADINPYLIINFTQNTTPSEMVDLLWFDVKDVASEKTISKTNQPVPIEFKHALSKVNFKFVDTYNHYELKSVELTGSVNQGTFYSGETAGWLPDLTQVAPYTLLDEQTNLNWTSGALYIIPQYLDGIFPSLGTNLDSGVDVVLKFVVTDSKGFGSQTIQIPLKDYTYRWELGKSYTYTITVNSDPIEFDTPVFYVDAQTVTM